MLRVSVYEKSDLSSDYASDVPSLRKADIGHSPEFGKLGRGIFILVPTKRLVFKTDTSIKSWS